MPTTIDEQMAGVEVETGEHDHFCVPAGMKCKLVQLGEKPLVFLDAMILPLRDAT